MVETEGLGIDPSGRLYWNGKPVEIVGQRLDLTRAQMGVAIAVAVFTVIAALATVFADGSVVGTIRPSGRRERLMSLPPETLRIEGSSMCAHLSGMILQPCFRVEKIDYRRFRGSIAGLGFA
jgi:hypothetical protein